MLYLRAWCTFLGWYVWISSVQSQRTEKYKRYDFAQPRRSPRLPGDFIMYGIEYYSQCKRAPKTKRTTLAQPGKVVIVIQQLLRNHEFAVTLSLCLAARQSPRFHHNMPFTQDQAPFSSVQEEPIVVGHVVRHGTPLAQKFRKSTSQEQKVWPNYAHAACCTAVYHGATAVFYCLELIQYFRLLKVRNILAMYRTPNAEGLAGCFVAEVDGLASFR